MALSHNEKGHELNQHLFERTLSVSAEQIEFELCFADSIGWLDFWLNPRRLRGSDFLMRWSQGAWSEERTKQAVNETKDFFALPYGPSGVAPDSDVREFELYFERLEEAELGKVKRPDLLIFHRSEEARIKQFISDLGGITELPFTKETDGQMQEILARALLAIECENSLWKARQMPDYRSDLKPQKRLSGKSGLKKGAGFANGNYQRRRSSAAAGLAKPAPYSHSRLAGFL